MRGNYRICSQFLPCGMPPTTSANEDGVLSAPVIIEYPFRRTTGPVIGAFLTGLRER